MVQLLSFVRLFVSLRTCQFPLTAAVSQGLFKFMSVESVRLSNHLILYCRLFLLPSVFPSIQVFSSE